MMIFEQYNIFRSKIDAIFIGLGHTHRLIVSLLIIKADKSNGVVKNTSYLVIPIIFRMLSLQPKWMQFLSIQYTFPGKCVIKLWMRDKISFSFSAAGSYLLPVNKRLSNSSVLFQKPYKLQVMWFALVNIFSWIGFFDLNLSCCKSLSLLA